MTRTLARGACCVFVSLAAFASGAHAAANPMGLAYKYTTNVALYAKPTGLIVTGRCNRYDPAFQTVRSKGGEVLAYLVPGSRRDHPVCALDTAFYMGDLGAVPLWPYPSYGQRSAWPNTRLTDMRPGSKWILHVVAYVEKLMRERKVDGVFLDVIGGRPYNQSNWTNWSETEKNLWTDGSVDLVRRLDAKRRAINPDFLIVNNNVWQRTGGNTRGFAAHPYIDGVGIEHHPVNDFHVNYIKKAFSNLGHRRILIIAKDKTNALAWNQVSAATHVAGQSASQYGYPLVPYISFKALNDR
jgi:hypothetical protein